MSFQSITGGTLDISGVGVLLLSLFFGRAYRSGFDVFDTVFGRCVS